MPKPSRPQFPVVCVGEATAQYPALGNVGDQPTPTQEAVILFAKPQYEAAAVKPPYTPHPAPQLAGGPWI